MRAHLVPYLARSDPFDELKRLQLLLDMEALLVNAGSWASLLGAVISTVGLVVAIIVAWGARSASRAAQRAAIATNSRIESHLQSVELQRAIWLIQRIKQFHDANRWDTAMEHYQLLRMMLSDIIARCPENQTEIREKLATARAVVTTMENAVRESIRQGRDDLRDARLDQSLNDIQVTLEELASAMGLGDLPRETT